MSRLQAAAHAAPLMLSVFIAVLSDREYGARKRGAVCGPERLRTSGKRAHLRAVNLLHGRTCGSYVRVQRNLRAQGSGCAGGGATVKMPISAAAMSSAVTSGRSSPAPRAA